MIREKRKSISYIFKNYGIFILFTVISAACIVCVLFYMNAYTEPLYNETVNLTDGDRQVYTLDGGVRTPLTADTESYYSGLDYPGQTFYSSIELTGDFENAVLQTNCFCTFSVFLDDELIYTNEIKAGTEIGELNFSGSFTQNTMPSLISLPDGYSGKTLTIAQAQPSAENPNMEGSVFLAPTKLYSAPALQSAYSSSIVSPSYLSAVLLISGIILIVIFLLGLNKRNTDFGVLFLSLFVFSWIFNILMRYDLAPYYFGSGEMWFDSYFYYCEFVFLNLFLLSKMTRLRKFYLPFVIVQTASVVLSVIASNLMDFSDLSVFLRDLPQLTSFFSVIAGIAFTVAQAFKGSAFCLTLAKAFAGSAGALGIYYIVSVIQGTGFYERFNDNWATSFSMGLFYYPLYILRYIMITACFIGVVIEFIRYLIKRSVELNTLQIKEAHAKESYDQMSLHADEISELKHDLKKHLATVDFFLQKSDVVKARDYLHQVGASIESGADYVNTGNELTDTLLNGKISECGKAGIKINCTFSALPEKLPFADTDVVSLLLNSIDNAANAVFKLNADEKIIKINIHIKNGFLYYSCVNKSEQRIPDGKSTIEHNGEHGYGLKIINKIVEKYRGIIEINKGGELFELNIALPLNVYSDK